LTYIHELLLNILFVLLPIFLYQSFWDDRLSLLHSSRNRKTVFLLSAVSVMLCMTFPVFIMPGYRYDLRLVPVVLCILYGGYGVGLALIALVYLYRLYLGGEGFFIMALTYPLLMGLTFYHVPRFALYSKTTKAWVAISLIGLQSLVVNGMLLWEADIPIKENPFTPLMFWSIAINMFTGWVAVYLIESIVEKARLRQEVQRSEKVHVLGELTASIAHEIRNPLTVVRGFLQLMKEDKIAVDKRRMYLSMAIEELDRAENIISNYLTFARPSVQKWEKVDIAERIHHVTNIIYSYALLRNVEIRKTVHGDDLFIVAEPEQISQVLLNMIKNGVEAMPGGGTLHINVFRQDEKVRIDIIDNGIGMTPDEVERLGTPFFSTKESGTGLGMMVCYQIIRSLGGHIHVKSEKGKGTSITLLLPSST
jgi:two-component system sporulation sensor kinase B